MTNSIRGVILAAQDYKEADVLLQVLTEDNVKMTMHARGVRKKSKVKTLFAHNCLWNVYLKENLNLEKEYIR